ncbi:MAG: uracil-DNA glycosylase [Rhodobacterales bacterium]|nr:MAG: uracil-DNA glycosylase [Rhodobacterales bacterium]
MDSALTWHDARSLLQWQIELGVIEAIGEDPINRYDLPTEDPWKPGKAAGAGRSPRSASRSLAGATMAPGSAKPTAPVGTVQAKPDTPNRDAIDSARMLAKQASSLASLRTALESYEHCDLKRGARSLVFADGQPRARVMIIGEAPGRDEDRMGKPFVGLAGQLLDKMFAAIGMGRDHETAPVYITNVLPWRPPQNRDPRPDEIAMLLPFLERHVELVAPELIVLMGNSACRAALGKQGITRLRGQWGTAFGRPALPMFHPAFLLRTPLAKRDAWADLLSLRAKLDAPG